MRAVQTSIVSAKVFRRSEPENSWVFACCKAPNKTLSTNISNITIETTRRAGPIVLQTSADDLDTAQNQTSHYRVMAGDILEFQMPSRLIVISSELSKPLAEFETYLSRVDDEGMIKLPIIGELNASGKTLSEIESMAIKGYYPKYVVTSPMIVCKVLEYGRQSERVFTVMGLVRQPNAFPYPPNVQYSLMEALAFAGGLDMVADPRYLKVY